MSSFFFFFFKETQWQSLLPHRIFLSFFFVSFTAFNPFSSVTSSMRHLTPPLTWQLSTTFPSSLNSRKSSKYSFHLTFTSSLHPICHSFLSFTSWHPFPWSFLMLLTSLSNTLFFLKFNDILLIWSSYLLFFYSLSPVSPHKWLLSNPPSYPLTCSFRDVMIRSFIDQLHSFFFLLLQNPPSFLFTDPPFLDFL